MQKDDVINRQAALEHVVHMDLFGKDYPVVPVAVLKKLPPAQQWIPCSEEMPEPNRSVLVQLSDDFVDPIQIMTLNISKCEGDFFYFWRTQEMGINFDMDDVVAWQPIPEPWEGAQHGV